MTHPFFSIVIPTLNEAKFIRRLLEDLANQSGLVFEVIIVDGKSTDTTVREIREFVPTLPLTFLKSPVANIAVQKNLGASIARGEYLVFLDADVQIGKNFLLLLYQAVKQTQGEFFGTYLLPDSEGWADRMVVALLNLGMSLSKYINRPFAGANCIIRKDIFEKINGFRKNIPHSQDFDFSLRLSQKGFVPTLLTKPRLTVSLRRYRYEGRGKVLLSYIAAILPILIKGAIEKDQVVYPMGGARYGSYR